MKYCKPKEIIDKIPEAQIVFLPENWFEDLSDDVSVYESLYTWMIGTRRVPVDIKHNLHNRTYASRTVAKRLRAEEKRRIARKTKMRGEKLERAVKLSDLNSGPHTLFGGRSLSGNVLVVLPTTHNEKADSLEEQMRMTDRIKHNNIIRSLACGANFSQWLFSNTELRDPVGDLARDAVEDKSFPIVDNCDEIREYLKSHSACSGALKTLDSAWQGYKKKYPGRVKCKKD